MANLLLLSILMISLVVGFVVGYYIFVKFPVKMAQSFLGLRSTIQVRNLRKEYAQRQPLSVTLYEEFMSSFEASEAWTQPENEFRESVRDEIDQILGKAVYKGSKEQL